LGRRSKKMSSIFTSSLKHEAASEEEGGMKKQMNHALSSSNVSLPFMFWKLNKLIEFS
jgi:hypothetical protein